jgi:hypothetical protein
MTPSIESAVARLRGLLLEIHPAGTRHTQAFTGCTYAVGAPGKPSAALDELKRARAVARERAWVLRGKAGRTVPTVRCGEIVVLGLVIDFNGSLVTCHSEKQRAAPNFKHGFGYHTLLVWLGNTNEALDGMLRPGEGGSNTAADHIRLTEDAISQIPDAKRHGQPITWSPGGFHQGAFP